MILAIEIGGTKLQLAVSSRSDAKPLGGLVRKHINREAGAAGILSQMTTAIDELFQQHEIDAIGIGFGGPVDSATGRVITSHQVAGWDGFPLVQWTRQRWPVPVAMGNDCNVAALAEATRGAGQGRRRVLYVTVGTGVGGGLVLDGAIDGEYRPAIAELGHLRPGLEARSPEETVESLASGLGIERAAVDALEHPESWDVTADLAADLRRLLVGGPITAASVAAAAAAGHPLAQRVLDRATAVLGWALAQATTLLAPEIIVIGGGVSLIGESFFSSVTRAWAEYVFPPLRGACEITAAELGEEVVLYGGIELARRLVVG